MHKWVVFFKKKKTYYMTREIGVREHNVRCVLFLLSFTALVPFIKGRFITSALLSPLRL